MSRVLQSPRHEALRAFIVEKRKAAGLTQAEVGKKLGRHQPFVSEVEAGQRRVSAVELMDIAEAIGFDPHEAVERMRRNA